MSPTIRQIARQEDIRAQHRFLREQRRDNAIIAALMVFVVFVALAASVAGTLWAAVTR